MGTLPVKRWLEEAGVRPSRRMGQSFLADASALDRIAREALAGSEEWILEIGAGPGNLTERLLAPGRRVVAIERDRRLAALCARRLAGRPDLTVVAGDALAMPVRKHLAPGTIAAAGNIPYSITGEIVRALGDDLLGVGRAVLLVQEEAADRMAAQPGSDGYGGFSILTQARWNVTPLFAVPAGSFHPRPEVDSRLVVLERPADPAVKPALYPLVRRLVHEAFQRRRKTLANGLQPFLDELNAFGDAPLVIRAAGLDPGQRPETVPVEGWVRIAEALRGILRS